MTTANPEEFDGQQLEPQPPAWQPGQRRVGRFRDPTIPVGDWDMPAHTGTGGGNSGWQAPGRLLPYDWAGDRGDWDRLADRRHEERMHAMNEEAARKRRGAKGGYAE